MALVGAAVALAVLTMPAASHGQARQPPPQNHALVKTWLRFPGLDRVAWPYAYIRAGATPDTAHRLRRGLLDEFKRVEWRLAAHGDAEFRKAVESWRTRLANLSTFRTPGRWSPGWLIAHPNQNPPLRAIDALGGCEVPGQIAIWDQHGIHRVQWQSGMDLFALVKSHPALKRGPATRVAVVTPEGDVDQYGIAAFNAQNTAIAPGSRIVASLPLRGEAFTWIRDRIAAILAYVPSGKNCREAALKRTVASG